MNEMLTIDPYFVGRMKMYDQAQNDNAPMKIGKAKRETNDGRYLIVYK